MQTLSRHTSPSRSDDLLQYDMLATLGLHVSQTARMLFIKLNVNACVPTRKYDTQASIISGSKRNLDDLKRIQSMLKGYMSTMRLDDSKQDLNEQEITKETTKYMVFKNKNSQPSTGSKLADKEDKVFENMSRYNFLDQNDQIQVTNISQISQKKLSNNKFDQQPYNQNSQSSDIKYIQNPMLQNKRLKKQIQKLSLQKQPNLFSQQFNLKTNLCDLQTLDKSNNDTKLPSYTNDPITKIFIANNSHLDRQCQTFMPILQNKQQYNSYSNQNGKNNKIIKQIFSIKQKKNYKKLNNCHSAIFDTGRNMQQIRTRNRECLDIIKSIKKQIGLHPQ